MQTIRSVDADVTVDEARSELERSGYLIVRQLVDRNTIEAVASELAPILETTPPGDVAELGLNTKRVDAAIAKSKTCVELVLAPLVLNLVDAILGPRCIHPQLSSTQAVQILPGEVVTPLHCDDRIYPIERPCPQHQIGAIWSISDFSPGNGATRVVPGSHLWDGVRQPRDDEATSVTMPAGSALIMMGSTWHSGGGNTAREARTALVVNYAVGWLRQEENQYLSVPRKIARQLPEELQKLMGYRSQGPSLGYYDGQETDWS